LTSPDARGWTMIGLFALTGGILGAVAFNPTLEKNELFSSLATLIVGAGGFLGAVGFMFGTSKASSDKDQTIATMAAQTPPASSVSVQTTQPLPENPTQPKET